MKENEWINVEDRLPGINTVVELKAKTLEKDGFDFQYSAALSELKTIHHIKCWRHIQEKRPNFSKLRKDDFIQIERECKKWKMFGGFVYGFDSNGNLLIGTAKGSWSRSTSLEYIKKITRINLEEQTFEEF